MTSKHYYERSMKNVLEMQTLKWVVVGAGGWSQGIYMYATKAKIEKHTCDCRHLIYHDSQHSACLSNEHDHKRLLYYSVYISHSRSDQNI